MYRADRTTPDNVPSISAQNDSTARLSRAQRSRRILLEGRPWQHRENRYSRGYKLVAVKKSQSVQCFRPVNPAEEEACAIEDEDEYGQLSVRINRFTSLRFSTCTYAHAGQLIGDEATEMEPD